MMFTLTPLKIAILALAYVAGYRFIAIYAFAVCLLYAAIGDNTR